MNIIKARFKLLLIVMGVFVALHYFVALIGHKQAAIDQLNDCPSILKALGKPIEEDLWALSYGNASSNGGFGYASWRMGVEGPNGKGVFEFYSEKHGGQWSMTAGRVTIGDHKYDISECETQEEWSERKSKDRYTPSGLRSVIKLCEEGNGGGCYALALNYLKGDPTPEDYEKAKAAFEKECDLAIQQDKNTMECEKARDFFGDGKKVKPDPAEVARLNEKIKAFAKGDATNRLASRLSELREQCDSQSVNALNSCQMLGRTYAEDSEVPHDLKLAEHYLDLSCDLTYLKKHRNLSRNPWVECYYVSEMYHHGEHGFPHDQKKALSLAKKVCGINLALPPGEARACGEAAKLIDTLAGKGTPEALDARKKACASGDTESCE